MDGLLWSVILALLTVAYLLSWRVTLLGVRALWRFKRLRGVPARVIFGMRQALLSDWYLSLLVPLWAFHVRRRVLTRLEVEWSKSRLLAVIALLQSTEIASKK
jgi:hypothetical protein